MSLISVIVPCYNAENTVVHSLDCLVNQTLQDLEIIAVDDGSTDHTYKVLQDYAARHPERTIRVFTKKNEGIAACRNFALTKVTGKYFGFLDADDETVPEMFEEMVQKAEETKAQIVVSDFYWKNSRGERLQKEGPYALGMDMMVHLFATLWNKIYLTEFVKNTGVIFPNGDRYEDACFLYCITQYVERLAFMEKGYVRYIQNESSITHTNNNRVKDMIDVFKIIMACYKETGGAYYYHDALEYIHVKFFLGNSFLRSARIKDPKDRKETIMMGWNLLNDTFPKWYKNPYLQTLPGKKHLYFRVVRKWDIMFFAWIFRTFLPENL